MSWSIYSLTHTVTGRTYVGRTQDPQVRKGAHLGNLQNGRHKNKWLFSEFLICGARIENWVFEILQDGIECKKLASVLERAWMASWPEDLCFNRECNPSYKRIVGRTISKAKTGKESTKWTPARRAKTIASLSGKKQPIASVIKRAAACCKPCTVDGTTIFKSKKDLKAALGNGVTGFKSPSFRYLPKAQATEVQETC